MGGWRSNNYTALVLKCFKVKGTNMLTVRLEQKKKKWDGDLFCYLLDLIPSQQIIIKTTVTTSHQSNVSFRKKKKKSELSVVC